MSSTPNKQIPYVPEGTLDPAAGLNQALNVIDAVDSIVRVISMDLTAPPGSVAEGDLYVVAPSGATGVWAGLEDRLVRYVETGAFWQSYLPGSQVAAVLNRADNTVHVYSEDSSPSGWAPLQAAGAVTIVDETQSPAVNITGVTTVHLGEGLIVTDLGGAGIRIEADIPPPAGEPTVCIPIACSDEATALVAATNVVKFRMPFAFHLTDVRASVTTAPTGSTLIVDINEAGASILSTKLSIDATEKTSTTAASARVISDANLADDAEISIDIDQIGSTIAGTGLKVYLIGYKA